VIGMNVSKYLACFLLAAWAGGLAAQPLQASAPMNVAQLSASGAVEVRQDLMVLSMNTQREGSDAQAVQAQLKEALDAALAIAKAAALPGQLDVRTGRFSLYPRYDKNGKTNGWQGSTELVLEGRDIARISATAGRIQTLTIGSISFGLSREQRAKVEGEAQSQAIARFKAKATDIARDFGFAGYTLREVSVNSNDEGPGPVPRPMVMQAKSMVADAPVPVEAGLATVLVMVSGTVQLK